LERRTGTAPVQILRRNNGNWAQLGRGAVRSHRRIGETVMLRPQSRGPCRVGWGRSRCGVHQSERGQRFVYTVKSNRQLGQDAGSGAIGGGRGWTCAGGRAIGGDALALQAHAWPWTDLPTTIARWGGGAGRACLGRGSSEQGGQRQRSYILPRCAGDAGAATRSRTLDVDAIQDAFCDNAPDPILGRPGQQRGHDRHAGADARGARNMRTARERTT
jgi:hypothetical protein